MKMLRTICILLIGGSIFLAISPFYQWLFVDTAIAASPWRWLLTSLGGAVCIGLFWFVDAEDKKFEAAQQARRAREEREKREEEGQRKLRLATLEAQEGSRRRQQGHAYRERLVTAAYEAVKTAVVGGKKVSKIGNVIQPEDKEFVLLLAAVQFEDGSYGVLGYADGVITELKGSDGCELSWLLNNMRAFPELESVMFDVIVWYNKEHGFIASFVPDSEALTTNGRSWQLVGHIQNHRRDKQSAGGNIHYLM